MTEITETLETEEELIEERTELHRKLRENAQKINKQKNVPHLQEMLERTRVLMPNISWDQNPLTGTVSGYSKPTSIYIRFSNCNDGPTFDAEVHVNKEDRHLYFTATAKTVEDAIASVLEDLSKLGAELISLKEESKIPIAQQEIQVNGLGGNSPILSQRRNSTASSAVK